MLIEDFEQLTAEQQLQFLGDGIRFDRIRRVTGYLNPDARQWNDGKQAELEMRVKHRLEHLDQQDHFCYKNIFT